MKIIKITLGIVIAISLVFFATGFVVKEVVYTTNISINKPLQEVFKTFSKVENQKLWTPEIDSIVVENRNPQHIGSVYKLSITNNDQKLITKQRVLAYVPNKEIEYRFNSDVMIRVEDYSFSYENKQTIITQKTTIRSLSYMLTCTFPWFKSNFEKNSQKYLENFKKLIEKP